MTLKDLKLQWMYTSPENVYKEFFNKVLKESDECLRFGGVFSSRTFADCASGMQEFVQNNGKMKLILVSEFSDEDVKSIQAGTKNEEDLMIKNWINEISEIKDKFEEDHVKALAWLLKEGFLEIKIIVVKDPLGKILNPSEMKKVGFLDRKIGIYVDKHADGLVSFSGQIGYDDKIFDDWYRFEVFRSWKENEKERINENWNYFDKLWKNELREIEKFTISTIDIPHAIEQEIIKKSPETKEAIHLQKSKSLFSYQKTALSKWEENDFRGIFEMATGTGKTFTAIKGIGKLEEKVGPLGVVVAVPSIPLINQWRNELQEEEYTSLTNQKNAKWQTEFENECKAIKNGIRKKSSIVVLHYLTYTKEDFMEKIKKINKKWNVPLLLIGDEVHNAGAGGAQKGLLDDYKYRIGLSATVDRYFDDIGTQIIKDKFGEVVITYDLGQAIADGRLVEYEYRPKYLELEPDELDSYRELSTKIAILTSAVMKAKKQKKDFFVNEQKLFNLNLKRARIIKNARQKIPAFKDAIDKDPKIKHTFVFCSGEQLKDVKGILNKRMPIPISSASITQNDPPNKEDRERILQDLANERYKVVIGIKILDEGIDVPEARNCFLLESTGNPKQFIQRRGRVLRVFRGEYKDGTKKEYAIINDFLIMPEMGSNASDQELNVHKNYIEKQLRRQIEMAKIAKNAPDCLAEIDKIKEKFGIDQS